MHYTWALISVIIRHGFGVPEVVLTILHFGDTVAVLVGLCVGGSKRKSVLYMP